MRKQRLLLPTNTNNLRMFISHGLIAPRHGFSKYYKDLLDQWSGWVPLYINDIPDKSLDYVISEDPKYLTPCILELDVTLVGGSAKAAKNGQLVDFDLNECALSEEIEKIFIQAPLPLSCLKNVLFKNKEDMNNFEIDVSTKSNIVHENIKLKSTKADQKLFSLLDIEDDTPNILALGDEKSPSLPSIMMPTCNEIDYSKIYAFGGMLSLLFYCAKNGSFSNSSFQNISDIYMHSNDDSGSSGPSLIAEYFLNTSESEFDKNSKKIIYHRVIKTAIEGNDFKNDLLNILENSDWTKEKEKERAIDLAKMLREYESNTSKKTVSQQFDVAKSELEKMLLMLFVREDSDSLARYTNVSFSEEEYIVFSMIFGIRDKFNRLPSWLKKYHGLQEFISNKMAEYAHSLLETDIKFNKFNRPPTVWELIEKKVIKRTIKDLKIERCIKTIMPKFTFSVSDKDGKVTYSSFLEPTYMIEEDQYFNSISTMLLTDKIYNKILNNQN